MERIIRVYFKDGRMVTYGTIVDKFKGSVKVHNELVAGEYRHQRVDCRAYIVTDFYLILGDDGETYCRECKDVSVLSVKVDGKIIMETKAN